MPRDGKAARATRAAVAALLACALAVLGSAAHVAATPARAAQVPAPPAPSTGVVGLALSGLGSHLVPPLAPTDKPYSTDCHALVDRGFTGRCVTASSSAGTVAGVVEGGATGRSPSCTCSSALA